MGPYRFCAKLLTTTIVSQMSYYMDCFFTSTVFPGIKSKINLM
jgi:hypothetical protein